MGKITQLLIRHKGSQRIRTGFNNWVVNSTAPKINTCLHESISSNCDMVVVVVVIIVVAVKVEQQNSASNMERVGIIKWRGDNDVSRRSLPWREATHRSERVGETTKEVNIGIHLCPHVIWVSLLSPLYLHYLVVPCYLFLSKVIILCLLLFLLYIVHPCNC